MEIVTGVIVYRTHQTAPLGTLEIVAIVVTILLFIVTVVVGGLLSVDLQVPAFVKKLHLVVPLLTLLSTAATLYLLLRGK